MQQQDVELHYFDVPSPHFESSVGPPEGVSDLREALQEASECSVVLGGPLDPDNHFDRALTAGLSFTSHHCPSPMRFPSSLPPVRCPQVPTARVPGALIAKRLRAAVQEQLHFTCSAGIAHNKILAKLGSSLNKPNKQAIILPRGVHDMMQARCWGQEYALKQHPVLCLCQAQRFPAAIIVRSIFSAGHPSLKDLGPGR